MGKNTPRCKAESPVGMVPAIVHRLRGDSISSRTQVKSIPLPDTRVSALNRPRYFECERAEGLILDEDFRDSPPL